MAKQATDILNLLRQLPEDDALLADVITLLAGRTAPFIKDATKPTMKVPSEEQFVDGAFNPGHMAELRDIFSDFNRQWQDYYGHQWPAFKDQIKTVTEMAKQHGIDLNAYAPETFSLSDITDKDSIFEASEAQLNKLIGRLENCQEVGLSMISDVKKKYWAKVLRKAVKVQKMCREKKPLHLSNPTSTEEEVWQYIGPLRYMLYVVRTDINTEDGTLDIVHTPNHLILACMTMKIGEDHAASHGIQGALIVIPPRHGKTWLMISNMAQDICINPHINHAIIHHNHEHARSRLKAVRGHFDNTLPVGRRRRALYPDVTFDTSVREESRLFVRHKGQRVNIHTEGNLSPWGIHAQCQGLTFHKLNFDDPSDEKEQAEEGTRARTNNAIGASWMSRRTGKRAFWTYICTRWHPDDFAGQLINLANEGKIRMAYYSQECGGPEDGFTPIWPSAGYHAQFLKERYAVLGPAQYACVYRNDPDTAESRRIKCLHYYHSDQWKSPQNRDENWKRFFDSADTTYYMSVDPAGTASKYSNLAGITYSALGRLRDSEGKEELKLVFLEFWSLRASQHDLTRTIADFYHSDHKVDRILIETTGGYHATAEDLVINHHIPTTKVIRRTPGTGTKESRLFKFSIHLEGGDVLFPGVYAEDEHGDLSLSIDRSWSTVALQLLRAGSMKDTNMLDCVRQQLEEVSYLIYDSKGMSPVSKPQRAYEDRKALFFRSLTRSRDPNRRRNNLNFLTKSSLR